MSADLPDMRPDSSAAMARMLVQTMHCDRAVFSRIKEDFDHPPCLRTIKRIRAEHLAGPKRKRRELPSTPSDGYWPTEESERAELVSAAFLRRLRKAYPERFAA